METILTSDIAIGDRIEPVNYGLGIRKVLNIEDDGGVRVLTLDGTPFDTSRGPTNVLRLRKLGQVVYREESE